MGADWQSVNATGKPTRYVGQIVAFYKNGTLSFGSGCLVGGKAVLTAGHCLMNPEKRWGGRPISEWSPAVVMFTPGLQGTQSPFSSANATEWTFPKGFSEGTVKSLDFGVMKLNRDLGGKTGGWAPLAAWPDDGDYNITVYGYPFGSGGVSWPLKLSDRAFNESSWTITDPDQRWRDYYKFYTYGFSVGKGGVSGGPAFSGNSIVGIFGQPAGIGLVRLGGMRLAPKVLPTIRAWIAGYQ